MKICKVCGETQEEHHIPDWLEIPDGCVCNWREWGYDGMSSLPPVCDHYEGNGTQNCSRCEHDKACHAAPRCSGPTPDCAVNVNARHDCNCHVSSNPKAHVLRSNNVEPVVGQS